MSSSSGPRSPSPNKDQDGGLPARPALGRQEAAELLRRTVRAASATGASHAGRPSVVTAAGDVADASVAVRADGPFQPGPLAARVVPCVCVCVIGTPVDSQRVSSAISFRAVPP
ncbi:hypothetical protein SCALM49S_05680 [Streptomyces californicus]